MNELAAAKDGLEPMVIDVVRNRKARRANRERCKPHRIRPRYVHRNTSSPRATYARVVKIFGERDLVDLVAVMGQHAAKLPCSPPFDQHLPAGQAPLWLRRCTSLKKLTQATLSRFVKDRLKTVNGSLDSEVARGKLQRQELRIMARLMKIAAVEPEPFLLRRLPHIALFASHGPGPSGV